MAVTKYEPSAAKPAGADRLRALEDKLFGKGHPRPHGQIEKGIGSAFADLPAAHKAHHDAIEKLIAAEKAHQATESAAAATRANLDAAIKLADETEKAHEAAEAKRGA